MSEKPKAGERWRLKVPQEVVVVYADDHHVEFEDSEHRYGDSVYRFTEAYERAPDGVGGDRKGETE